MRSRFRLGTLLGIICGLASLAARGAEGPDRAERPLILVHYMPWFESKPVSGHWGWHWTMGRLDPERIGPEGRRQIASHSYPLIGPYDSGDPDVLEYHTLLMKVGGIDGVVADWYGSEDFNDYAPIHRRTSALIDALKRRGLKFAACYEDRALKAMAERRKWTSAQVVEHGKTHLRYCERNWFQDPSYVRWEGKPLLLAFGPDYLTKGQWQAIFAEMRRAPAFFTLHERRPPAIGAFAWPPMWASKDGKVAAEALDAYLDRFYGQAGARIGAAFPGFHDFYAEAGVQPSHGFLDDRNGETFRRTLGRALESGSPIVQVVTWNDFGEGTAVEPTREYSYRYMEAIQKARRRLDDRRFPYRAGDLRLPRRIYDLRKRLGRSANEQKGLDEAVHLLSDGDVARASQRLDGLERAAPEPSKPAR